MIFMRGSREFARRGPILITLFCFFYEGREYPNSTKSGPSSARQRNAIKMTFSWQADGGLTSNLGLVAL